MIQEVDEDYENGACWVELAPLADPALVAQTVAKALHVPEQAELPTLQKVLDVLQERSMLLVLDNCEHLPDACAQLVETVLTETEASVLATSRQSLGVIGEKLYPVAPLSLPPASFPDSDVEGIDQSDAVHLFVERAQAIVPAFELTPNNAGAIARICHGLDGIPLAIELASARVNVLALEQIAARLDNHFELLPATTHATYNHHETLRAAIAWSHDLLSDAEQVLLRRLSVFAGGCSLTTAERVCAGENFGREQIVELLSSLVNKSLIVADTLHRGEARYSLLESIRQFGQERLTACEEALAIRDRHLQCFLELAEETAPKLQGEYQEPWLKWLESEYDNFRVALRWSLERGQMPQERGKASIGASEFDEGEALKAGLRIALAIHEFWLIRDYVEEGLTWFERLLAQADEAISPVIRASALAYASFLAGFYGNIAAQSAYGREAEILADTLGDDGQAVLAWTRAGKAYAQGRPGPLPNAGSTRVWAMSAQAYGARATGDYQAELSIHNRIIEHYRQSGERLHLGIALITGSSAAMSLGKYGKARAMLDEGLPLLRETANPYWVAMSLNGSGDLARCQENYSQAQIAYEESIGLLRELDAVRDLASVLHNLGHTYLHLDDVTRARDLFNESLTLQQTQQNRPGIAECLIGFAALAIYEGSLAAGTRLLAAAEAIGGQRVTTAWEATRLEYERYLAQARTGLAENEFQKEQAKGRILTLAQAVANAQEVAAEASAAEKARKKLDELTLREREVAALIAQAKSNGEIAEELVLSKRTVEKHIANIRAKLAFTKRAQIVRWAIVSGLINASRAKRL